MRQANQPDDPLERNESNVTAGSAGKQYLCWANMSIKARRLSFTDNYMASLPAEEHSLTYISLTKACCALTHTALRSLCPPP